jgi:hypothetical protein
MPKPIERMQASSGDDEFYNETLNLVEAMVGQESGNIPDELDDVLLGQNATNDPEIQYQRGQEVAVMEASLGWQYTVESLYKMVDECKKEHEAAVEDADILRTHREYRTADKIVNRIIALVRVAAQTPHPDDLPR